MIVVKIYKINFSYQKNLNDRYLKIKIYIRLKMAEFIIIPYKCLGNILYNKKYLSLYKISTFIYSF